MNECTEKYLHITEEIQELEDMMEKILDDLTFVRFKSKLSKIEYEVCQMHVYDNMNLVATKKDERVKALEEEVKTTRKHLNMAIRYTEKIRQIQKELCDRLKNDGLLDKYWGNFES